jgi:AraC-like DNA-binding protein
MMFPNSPTLNFLKVLFSAAGKGIQMDLTAFIYFASVAIGLVSGLVLIYFGWKYHRVNMMLGLGYLFLCIGMFVGLSLVSGIIQYFPFIYRWGNFFGLLFVPMPFLYTFFSIRNRPWRRYDFLHFLPALFYFVDFSHVLFLSSAQKSALIQSEIGDLNVYAQFNQSRLLPSGLHLVMRTAFFGIYWFAQIYFLTVWRRRLPSVVPAQNRSWLNFMLGFVGIQALMVFPFFFGFFWKRPAASFTLAHATAAIFLYVTSCLLFFFPSVLYGKKEKSDATGKGFTAKKASTVPMTAQENEKMAALAASIEKTLNEQAGYLNHGYSIHQFAHSLQVPAYQVTNCLNQYMKTSFIDLINQKRILYCVQQWKLGIFDHYTLEAIAEKSGFSNRNSFATAFKKVTGSSPSAYRSSLEAGK